MVFFASSFALSSKLMEEAPGTKRSSSIEKGRFMKFKLNNKYVRWGVTAFLVLAAAITFYYFVFHSSNIVAGFHTIIDVLMPVVFGMAIAYLLTPILNFLEAKLLIPLFDKLKIKKTAKRNSVIRVVGIMITVFLFLTMIYILFAMLISQIVPSVEGIISNFDSYTNNVIAWINQIFKDNTELGQYATKTIDSILAELEKWLKDIIPTTVALIKTISVSVMNVLSVLWDFVIGFIISIYMLASKERFAGQIKKVIYAVFERDTANITIRNFRFTHRTFIGFLGGKVIDSICIGILCFIGTSIMGTPYPALVSVIIGVTNIIPFFGPFLGAIPSTILIFVVDPMHPLNCVYFVIFVFVLQQFDGNILGPKILGDSTGLTGFWVIFAITLFGGLYGVLGMIVGVPIFAVIYAAVKAIVNTMLEKKKMPKGSEEYEDIEYVDEDGFHHLPKDTGSKKGNKQRKSHLQEGFHWKWSGIKALNLGKKASEGTDLEEDANESEDADSQNENNPLNEKSDSNN